MKNLAEIRTTVSLCITHLSATVVVMCDTGVCFYNNSGSSAAVKHKKMPSWTGVWLVLFCLSCI